MVCGALLAAAGPGAGVAGAAGIQGASVPESAILGVSLPGASLPGVSVPGAGGAALHRIDGLEAHRLVSVWMQQDRVDRVSAPTMRRDGVVAVAVILRQAGVVVGVGEAEGPGLSEPGAAGGAGVDVTGLLAEAAEKAFERVRTKLRLLPPGAEGRGGDFLSTVSGTIRVDVQIAHGAVPIFLTQDDGLFAVLDRYAPGHHGVVVQQAATGRQHWSWPSVTLQSNSAGERELRRLAVAAGEKAEQWVTFGRPGRLPLWRFDVMHVVQASPLLPAAVLTRGQQVLPVRAMRRATLEELAARLTFFLEQKTSDEGVVSGVYLPTAARHREGVLNDASTALVGYALARRLAWAERAFGREVVSVQQAGLQQRAQAIWSRLYSGLNGDPASDPLVAALLLLTITDGGLDPVGHEAPVVRRGLVQALVSLADDQQQLMTEPGGATALPATVQSLIAAALGGAYAQAPEEATGRLVARVWENGWAQAYSARPEGRPNELIDPLHLIWLSVLESRVGDRLQDAGLLDPQRRSTLQAHLTEQMNEALAIQVQTVPSVGPADVYGGYLVDGFPGGAPPMPDWRSAQVLLAAAAAQRSPSLMKRPGVDVLGWRFSSELGARFMGQLTMDEWSAFYCRSPLDAIGGLRASVIDNTVDPVATAMGLLAIDELLQTRAGQ